MQGKMETKQALGLWTVVVLELSDRYNVVILEFFFFCLGLASFKQ